MINHNWVFGHGAGINFQNGVSTFHASLNGTATIKTDEGCASVSDDHGNLYFYTDGMSVWDGSHTAVIPSLGLTGDKSATQSAIIVPVPGSEGQHYIFTVGASDTPHYKTSMLKAAKVWRDSAGAWHNEEVDNVNKYDIDPPTTATRAFTERVTAVQFPDCSGAWVLTTVRTSVEYLMGKSNYGDNTQGHFNYGHLKGMGMIRIFRVDASGVTWKSDYRLDAHGEVPISHHGYLRVSPDKRRVAFANGLLENVVMMDFDVNTGTLSNTAVIPLNRDTISTTILPETTDVTISTKYDLIVYGLEFSPNSRNLYFSVNTHNSSALATFGDPENVAGFIMGIRLDDPDLTQKVVAVERAGEGGGYTFGALQLGPDALIYVARDSETALGALLNANDYANVSYNATAVTLSEGSVCALGLPNLLPAPCPVDDCDCGGEEECDCGCSGCNENAKAQNEELLKQAIEKSNDVRWGKNAPARIEQLSCFRAVNKDLVITPFFYFSWGDGSTDRIEEHDTEIVYITVCNPYSDLEFKGVRLNAIHISTESDVEKMRIVPDGLVTIDCLPPCSSASREFALITRGTDIAGLHQLEVDYCIDEVALRGRDFSGKATFKFSVTED